MAIYYAKSTTAHSSIVSTVNTQGGSAFTGFNMTIFALNNAGTIGNYCGKRLSLAAIHAGMTSTQSNNFYNAIQTLRTALGGGYV